MTAAEYRAIRETLGSQGEVAKLLGVDRTTVARREAVKGKGKIAITPEAEYALLWLQKLLVKKSRKKACDDVA